MYQPIKIQDTYKWFNYQYKHLFCYCMFCFLPVVHKILFPILLRILFNYFRMVLQSFNHQSDAYIYHDVVILLHTDVHSLLALSVCLFIIRSKRVMIPQPTMFKQCSVEDIFFSQLIGQLEVFISLVSKRQTYVSCPIVTINLTAVLSPVLVYSFVELYVAYIVSI